MPGALPTEPMAPKSPDNLLLQSLSTQNAAWNGDNAVILEQGVVLYEAEAAIKDIIFPANGTLISLLAVTEDGAMTEVTVVGAEGAVGFNVLLGGKTSPFRVIVQIPGKA